MTSLKNKTAMITGASSGIGKACAEHFAQLGLHLILVARRKEKLEVLAQDLINQYQVKVLCLPLDIQNKAEVQSAFAEMPESWKKIDILVNNAGIALDSVKFQDGNIDNWDNMINTNIRGLLYLTKAVLPSMLESNSGHIVNVGSVGGREYYPCGNIYSATKHAVHAITKSLQIDLLGTGIRTSEVDPGIVKTELSMTRWNDKERVDQFYSGYNPLQPEDIADSIVYCVSRPAHVNIAEMVIFPSDQASCSLLYRKNSDNLSVFNHS